jgi:hypothetical protein
MLGMILNFLGGGVITSIVNGVLNAYKAKLAASSTTEAHEVDLAKAEILGEIALRQAEASIIRQEQGWWVTAIIRPLLAFPVVIYMWKVVVFDTVLHLGTTPALGGAVGDWAGWIVLAYVGGRSIEKVARIFRVRR